MPPNCGRIVSIEPNSQIAGDSRAIEKKRSGNLDIEQADIISVLSGFSHPVSGFRMNKPKAGGGTSNMQRAHASVLLSQ